MKVAEVNGLCLTFHRLIGEYGGTERLIDMLQIELAGFRNQYDAEQFIAQGGDMANSLPGNNVIHYLESSDYEQQRNILFKRLIHS